MTQQAHTFTGETAETSPLNYLLFLPAGYESNSGQSWPLIFFLHGIGQRGDDLDQIKKHGIPHVVEERADFPFIAVSPQCPEDQLWWDKIEELLLLLDKIITTYAVDPKRVYLTGLSIGGYATWYLAAAYPERFAAIVPVSAGGLEMFGFPEKVCALKNVPIWTFHGARDKLVPLAEAEKMVNTLQACGGQVRLTVYTEAEHDAWTETYSNPELYEWLLQQRRS